MDRAAAHTPDKTAFRRLLLIAVIAGAALISLSTLQLIVRQTPGIDFLAFWAGAKTALAEPSRLYDFQHITAVQGWPLGPGVLRPFPYPPSALLVLTPFTLPSYWAGYVLWILATLAVYVWGGRRIDAPWWFILLPSVAFVAYCGQATFLIGGLVMAGLSLRSRPLAAGLMFGLAAAIKPQLLVLLPVALLALRDWKTIAATGLTGATLCALSALIWGIAPWFEWVFALGRFQTLILATPSLVADALTPYAALVRLGADGAWAFLLAPLALAATWMAFRREAILADRLIALLGGALALSPYAMHYEIALLAPALALYLARRDDAGWPLYVVSAFVCFCGPPPLTLPAILILPLVRIAATRWRPAQQAILGSDAC